MAPRLCRIEDLMDFASVAIRLVVTMIIVCLQYQTMLILFMRMQRKYVKDVMIVHTLLMIFISRSFVLFHTLLKYA